jgi:hypothetical protein
VSLVRNRWLLLVLAFAFLAWELVAVILWVRQSGGLPHAPGHFWQALRSDWMALLVVSDHLLVAGTVLVALWIDAKRMGWQLSRRWGLVVAFVVLGSPAMLAYLVWHLNPVGPDSK